MIATKETYDQILFQYQNEDKRKIVDVLIELNKQLLTDFENIYLRLLIAELYFITKDYEAAVEEIEEIIEIEPDFISCYVILQKIYKLELVIAI